ncbi:MAG TPA: hypothetical protein VGE42_05615, partial [Candidatus Dormibacteraeota bacterium]
MSELSPQLRQAFADVAAESGVSPSAAFQARARAAMHAAVETRAARGARWTPLRDLAGRRAGALGAALATATASVLVAGWSAPASSPLHPVRLVREQVTLALPGGDRAGRELGFAEDRLREATSASQPAEALTEASTLLAAAGRDLHGGAGAQWGRWSRDQARLSQAEGTEQRVTGASGPGHTEDGSGIGGGPSLGGASGGAGPNPLPAGGSSAGDGPHRGSASPTGRTGAPVDGGPVSPGGSGGHGGGAQPTAAATTSTGTSSSSSESASGRDGSGGGPDPGGGSS